MRNFCIHIYANTRVHVYVYVCAHTHVFVYTVVHPDRCVEFRGQLVREDSVLLLCVI